jgi:hypothetical protein
MQPSNSSKSIFVPWESTPAYTALLKAHFEDYSNRVFKVKLLEIDQSDAEKQTAESILNFIEKATNYLKLFNVPILFSEDKNNISQFN